MPAPVNSNLEFSPTLNFEGPAKCNRVRPPAETEGRTRVERTRRFRVGENSRFELTDTVWSYYHAHKRAMPWRNTPTPYNVLVSEVMLQQTQVPRVLPKFADFTTRFPNFASLAAVPLADVLAAWSGLGYNRRAKFLWETAKIVGQNHGGKLPANIEALVALPGIGPNTAGAILAYAFNQPAIFIETNIRTVIIHHFFASREGTVKDAQIKQILQQALPAQNPREWYWALMDYGTHLKATAGTHLHRVHGYRKQSTFKGSRRQIRGHVLRLLLEGGHTATQLGRLIPDERLSEVLAALHQEGLLSQTGATWHLTGQGT